MMVCFYISEFWIIHSELILYSFMSSSFASTKLDSSIFFDIFDIDKSNFIDSFEDSVSRQSSSSEDDTNLFESKPLCFFQKLFCQKFSSIWCAFFASFVSEFPCSASEHLVPVLIYEGKDGIVVSSLYMKHSRIYFEIFLFLWSSSFCFCSSSRCSHLINNNKW